MLMSFDRYLPICQPLRCAAIMAQQLCILLLVAAWVSGFTFMSSHLGLLSKLTFCASNKIQHFSCDNSPLFQLSCSDTSLLWRTDSVLTLFTVLGSLCLTLSSYVCIFFCILHVPSGRKKDFATCSSHLIASAIAFGSCLVLCSQPSEHVSLETSKTVALLSTVLYPFFNPFTSSLRNKLVALVLKDATAHARVQLFPHS